MQIGRKVESQIAAEKLTTAMDSGSRENNVDAILLFTEKTKVVEVTRGLFQTTAKDVPFLTCSLRTENIVELVIPLENV